MPKSYNDVVAEYQQFKQKFPDDPTPITDFAKQLDSVQGVQDRTEAYDPSTWKKVNAAIDRGFDWTPAPGLIASPADTGEGIGRAVGEGFDRLTGTEIAPTVGEVGRMAPRMIAEGIATAPAGGAGGVARLLSVLGKVGGYGSAFARGTADTGSLVGGAVDAASLGLGNVLVPKAGVAAERGLTKLLERNVPDLVPGQTLAAAPAAIRRGAGSVANVAGGAAAATGINEATRQASLTTMPDEMRTEGDRNPLTAENIAGNVAGASFFLPQLMTGLMRGGPRVSPKQTEQLGTQLEFQKQQANAAYDTNPITKGPAANPRQEALFNILEQSIENRKLYSEDGRVDDVSRLDTTIEEAYNEIVSGRFSEVSAETNARLKTVVDDIVKFQQPDTPEKFQELADMIRSNLDFLNEGRVKFESELAQREAALNVNDKKAVAEFKTWKAEQERRSRADAEGQQTWHPKARAPQVLDRVWASGDLQPLTPEWLAKEWNVTFDETGNPTMSNQVLAQKLTNYYADRMDAAVASEAMKRKADTTGNAPKTSTIDAQEKTFIEALSRGVLPKPVLRGVLERTREFRNTERVDARSGQTVTRNRQWQQAIIRAVESFDPATETVLLAKKGTSGKNAVFERVPVSRLVEKKGEYYAWEPQERRVLVGEGGKRVAEDNIEALKQPSGDFIDIADEEAFKRALAEQSTGEGLFGAVRDNTDLALDAENRLLDPALDVIDESGAAETSLSDKMTAKNETLKKNLASLNDEQLWQLAEPLFNIRNSVQRAGKQKNLRLAMTAALENLKTDAKALTPAGREFLAMKIREGSVIPQGKTEAQALRVFLRDFFQNKVGVEGSRMKGEAPSVQRLGELVTKLLDEGTLKRVKSGGPMTKAQESVSSDRVEYNRLQAEMRKLGFDKAGTPEFNKLWQASEAIKNRNGGMPPGEVAGGKVPSLKNYNLNDYGLQSYWMKPDGTLVKVDAHETFANKETGIPPDYTGDAYEDSPAMRELLRRGWVRVADSGGERYFTGKLNTKQRALLETEAIQKERTLIDSNGKTIYQPPKAQGISIDDSPGTLANPPRPDNFISDVHRTLRRRIDTLLGRAGYSGTTRQFYTELAVALARDGALPNLDFYRIGGPQLGMASQEFKGRANLGVNVDSPVAKGNEAKAVLQLVQTLAHEIGHLDGYLRDGLIAKPDAYSEERARLVKNFDEFGNSLTEDERQAMMTVIEEYVPAPLRNTIRQADGRPYGTSNPDEFAQQMRGYAVAILAHETPQGRAAARELLDYAPVEVRELYKDTFRTVKDVMESMRLATEDPSIRVDLGEPSVLTRDTDPFILSRGFETMLDTARFMTGFRYADKAMAEARVWVTNFDKAPNLDVTNSVWFTKDTLPTQMKAQESLPLEPSTSAAEAVTVAKDFMNGPRAFDKSQRLGIVGRFLTPFRQQMWALERNGNKVAKPIADNIFQLEAGSHRILSNLLSDFMKRSPDGSVKFDAENPLIKRISEERTGRWRDAVNAVSKWQQETHQLLDAEGKPTSGRDAQSLFVQNEKGELVANPQVKGAQEFWDKTRATLSKEDQQFVASQSFVLDKLGQRARDTLTASIAESNVNRATALVMATNKRMDFDTAARIAKAAHDAFLSGNVMSLGGTIPAPQMEMLQRLFTGPDGKSGLVANYLDVVKHFENRPGYRSESLPHDWIVRYRDRDGKVKFDSRPTESQAQALAKNLQGRGYVIDGEIVDKRSAAQFSPTDDPDGILTKVTERENFVWNKFVEEMGQKHGGQFASDLTAGYTPMERTMRDVSASGVGKFLKERKNFVDRDSFDYIDSSLAYAERLAYTVAVRSMKQRVELLLNDPSVRLQTSFQSLVRGHVQEMLRPQNQTMKELKGIVSGMMLGGNLSSVVVNAMQSLQTLVPVLDLGNGSKGNFITPWKQLGRAIGDATDFTLDSKWKTLAAQTKQLDPKSWTEDQTVAELWRRQVEAGGFSHTVVDDLVYGQDQKMLTNAKFGRGDYGPVTKASMLRSGAYLANQFAMKPFRWVEHGNAKVAFLAGARQAYKQGLRGDAAYAKAAQVQGLATFGGGRANATGLQTALSKGFTPGGAGLALALQQYGFGMLAMHGQFVRDALGRSKGLSAAEVWHARRAYGTFLMTQTALAGVLGMPLVGATLTALEKVFGIPANQAVRDGLASLGEDDETGATIAEVGLNGFGDYWTGLDVSSRLGTSSLLGTSSYRGFNLEDLAGPVGSLVQGAVKSLGYFGQGEPMKAATALAPNAMKKALEMTDSKAKYGDYGFRDKAGNLLYMPTDTQIGAYALGFRPRELSRKRQLQSALTTANELTTASRDRDLDRAAQGVLRGDTSLAQRMSQEALDFDPINGPSQVLRAIMDRAVAATQEKDLLATGSRYNAERRSSIYRTFGDDVAPRQSETAMQDLRMQLAGVLGDPTIAPNAGSYRQAAVIDSLVEGGSMPRSEAVRLVQMLGL